MVRARVFPLVIALSLPAACDQAPADRAFAGLTRADAAFTMSPDHCELSMLFDNFRIEAPAPKRRQRPDRLFEVAGGHGRPVVVEVRGALNATYPATAKVAVSVAGQAVSRDVAASDRPFGLRYEFSLPDSAAPTPVRIDLSLAPPSSPGEAAVLDVDSLDMALPDEPPCR